MSNIKLAYNKEDDVQVKKTFDVLMVWFDNDKDQVLAAMNQNQIAITNQVTWHSEINKKVNIIQEWAMDAVMVRGKQCRHEGIVYNIIQTHTVNNETFIPPTIPALYRKAPVIEPGQTYPTWDSIGLLDSENYWRMDDIVHWNDKDWQSTHAINIWEPGVSQWNEVGAVVDPPVDNPCEGVDPWVGTQHWSTYTVGDRRTDGGGLYELHTQAWAQSYAPSSAYGNLGWTFIQACS